jgi:N-acetylglucosaminyl-diphospho-decaprenol L-rhamnosyltransferase
MKAWAVCIVNYNTRDLLRSCLRSVVAEGPDEVIVVDNDSTDGSAAMVRSEFPSVRLIEPGNNLGYGAAANQAVATTRADNILLLNADTELGQGALAVLREQLETHRSDTMLGPRTVNPDGTPQTSCFHFPTPVHVFLHLSGIFRWIPRVPLLKRRSLQATAPTSPTEVPWVLGSALAFRRETFEVLGGFDEDFFMYFEEVDLCLRLARAGGRTRFVPAAEIVHTGGASTDQQRAEMRIEYFVSLARFYRKHYSPWSQAAVNAIVRLLALPGLARALLLSGIVRDDAGRAELRSERAIHSRLLFGRWDRGSGSRAAA